MLSTSWSHPNLTPPRDLTFLVALPGDNAHYLCPHLRAGEAEVGLMGEKQASVLPCHFLIITLAFILTPFFLGRCLQKVIYSIGTLKTSC